MIPFILAGGVAAGFTYGVVGNAVKYYLTKDNVWTTILMSNTTEGGCADVYSVRVYNRADENSHYIHPSDGKNKNLAERPLLEQMFPNDEVETNPQLVVSIPRDGKLVVKRHGLVPVDLDGYGWYFNPTVLGCNDADLSTELDTVLKRTARTYGGKIWHLNNTLPGGEFSLGDLYPILENEKKKGNTRPCFNITKFKLKHDDSIQKSGIYVGNKCFGHDPVRVFRSEMRMNRLPYTEVSLAVTGVCLVSLAVMTRGKFKLA